MRLILISLSAGLLHSCGNDMTSREKMNRLDSAIASVDSLKKMQDISLAFATEISPSEKIIEDYKITYTIKGRARLELFFDNADTTISGIDASNLGAISTMLKSSYVTFDTIRKEIIEYRKPITNSTLKPI